MWLTSRQCNSDAANFSLSALISSLSLEMVSLPEAVEVQEEDEMLIRPDRSGSVEDLSEVGGRCEDRKLSSSSRRSLGRPGEASPVGQIGKAVTLSKH